MYIFLCCPSTDIGGRAQQPFDAAEWIRSHPAYASQLGRVPRHPEGRWLTFYDVRCRSWSRGRVALVGDAAHAMSPNLGQGACTAMSNALALGQAVTAQARTSGRRSALWESSERPYTDRIAALLLPLRPGRHALAPAAARPPLAGGAGGRAQPAFRRAMSEAAEHVPRMEAAS